MPEPSTPPVVERPPPALPRTNNGTQVSGLVSIKAPSTPDPSWIECHAWRVNHEGLLVAVVNQSLADQPRTPRTTAKQRRASHGNPGSPLGELDVLRQVERLSVSNTAGAVANPVLSSFLLDPPETARVATLDGIDFDLTCPLDRAIYRMALHRAGRTTPGPVR